MATILINSYRNAFEPFEDDGIIFLNEGTAMNVFKMYTFEITLITK